MKKISVLVLATALLCSCQQQQAPRNTIRIDVPMYSNPSEYKGKKSKKTAQMTMVSLSGPEAEEWDKFDRADAAMKYREMSLEDKTILFETIARVYRYLPKNNKQSSQAINTGIWKEVTDKGVDLSFGDTPSDWHPYIMYVHPMVIAEMTHFYLNAKPGSITDEELNAWKIAGANLINTQPDYFTMATLLARKDDLAKAGIIITEKDGRYRARTKWVNWDKYRAATNP